MNEDDLIEIINGISTADELRDFARETLGISIAHNASESTARKKILAHISSGGSGEPEGGAGEVDTPNDAPTAAEDDRSQSASKDSDEEAPKPRLLKNTKNGRIFVYTEALSKLEKMVETEQ